MNYTIEQQKSWLKKIDTDQESLKQLKQALRTSEDFQFAHYSIHHGPESISTSSWHDWGMGCADPFNIISREGRIRVKPKPVMRLITLEEVFGTKRDREIFVTIPNRTKRVPVQSFGWDSMGGDFFTFRELNVACYTFTAARASNAQWLWGDKNISGNGPMADWLPFEVEDKPYKDVSGLA